MTDGNGVIDIQEIIFFDGNAAIGRTSIPHNSPICSPDELVNDMKKIRLSRALVFHTESLNDPVFGNDLLIKAIAEYPELTGCAVLAPAASGEFGDIAKYVEYLVGSGIKAIRLFPRIHFYTIKSYVLSSVLEQALRYRLPVILDFITHERLSYIESTWDFFPDYDDIYLLAKEWPEIPFIVAIPGMTSQRRQYALLNACENVFLETSGYSYRFIENVCKRFSANRLIAGSYMPRVDPSAMMLGVLYANISEREKQMIANDNLEKLIACVGKRENINDYI